MEQGLQKKVLPHNLTEGAYLRHFKKLINTAQELGGTVYEVAEDSGLLSAHRFMQMQSEGEEAECLMPANMAVVTEVYVDFGNGEPLNRIFLFSKNAMMDRALLQEGEIKERKLVIPYEKLASLHERGYKCIYGNAADGRNGKFFVRYNNSFGEDKRLFRYEMWDLYPYVGNGFNQGLMLQTPFEDILVMPDIYAVQESIKTWHAENLIRETESATFSIERIHMADPKVLSELRQSKADILLGGDATIYDELRDSYKKLMYQIAYIKVYYPKVYEIVWAPDFEADDENTQVDIFWDNGNYVTLGICLGSKETHAVCKMTDGTLKPVPNMEYSPDTPLCQKYGFKGYGNIRNAGAAGSRMALIIKDIIKSAEAMLDVSVQKVNIAHPEELPGFEEIDWWMNRRRNRAVERKGTDACGDLIAYDQIADLKLNGEGVIRWATEQAEVSDMVLVDALAAAMKAFEVKYPGLFQTDKVVALYHFTEEDMAVSLIKKHGDGSFEIVEQSGESHPEDALFCGEDCEAEEVFPLDLQEILERDMEDYMLESGLAALGISVYSPYDHDMEAWMELRGNSGMVKRQFRRNDAVNILFDNGFLQVEREYPIERLEKCFAPVLEKSMACLNNALNRAGMKMEDISELLMIGEETEYPFVRKHMEQLVGKEAKCLYMSECVEAKGAAIFE